MVMDVGADIMIQVDASAVVDRFGRVLPESARSEIEAEFRRLAGRLEELVLTNIREMFTESGRSTMTPHEEGRLEKSILATVAEEGDIFFATVSPQLDVAPYARILELGGVTSAHMIVPIRHTHLKIPVATFRGYEAGEIEEVTQEFFYLPEVEHKGSRVPAFYYLRKALLSLESELRPSIEQAIGRAIDSSGGGGGSGAGLRKG
jgi:hypothetical protein